MRCIVHIDMDCFYAQVEAVRLGIDCRTEPYILSQWGNLIAVNYPARKCGVVRFNNVDEAKEKCPHVKISHVATYAVGEAEYKYHANPRKATHKVALEPYREASRKIFDILRSFEGVDVEKGSVDEAYLDVTTAAQSELEAVQLLSSPKVCSFNDVLDSTTNIIHDRRGEIDAWITEHGQKMKDVFSTTLHPSATEENLLLLGAASAVVHRIRQKIWEELRYDCSAGIAHNKLLAKSISSRHKPNQQTLLLPDRVASSVWDMPYQGFRGFGGKFGELLRRACGGVELCRDAWLVPKETLTSLLGTSDAEHAYLRLRGYDEGIVKKQSIAKTLMASKAFKPATSTVEGVKKWVTVLSGELCVRYKEFCDTYSVRGHTLNVKMGSQGLSQMGGVANKTLPLPELVTVEALTVTVMRYVATVLTPQSDIMVNAVSLTIGSLKPQESKNTSQSGQQLILTNFFGTSNPRSKRQRKEPSEISVVTLSSDATEQEGKDVHVKTVGDREVTFIE